MRGYYFLGNFMAGVTYVALVTCMLCGPILDKVHSNMEDKVGAFICLNFVCSCSYINLKYY